MAWFTPAVLRQVASHSNRTYVENPAVPNAPLIAEFLHDGSRVVFVFGMPFVNDIMAEELEVNVMYGRGTVSIGFGMD